MDKRRILQTEGFHISVLWSFAVAQPLYDLLGRQPEFFAAHMAGPADLVAFVLLLSVAPPLLYAAALSLIGAISPALRRWSHLLSVAVLFGFTMLPVLKRIDAEHAAVVLIGSLLLAIAFAAAYALCVSIRTFCTVLAPAVILFPLLFLFFTPVVRLLLPESDEDTITKPIKNPVPIVMILFDEFNPTVLLDDSGRIDEVRFPHFAALAKDSWWFRNATSVYPETNYAIPAILSGQYASPGQSLPIHAYHPRNLLAWLGTQYRMHVSEVVTELCPRSICPRDDGTFGFHADPQTLLIDLGVTYLHIITPQSLAERWLPDIDSGWMGFARPRRMFGQPLKESRRAGGGARASELRNFIDGLLIGDRTFNFLHILLPHARYQYLPSGREYFHPWPLKPKEQLAHDRWYENETLVEAGYLQYMLQVGYVDRMIGNLLAKLKAAGRYDESLIIITADHGVTIEPGKQRRELTTDTAASILQIPLFIKLPSQTVGRLSERRVSGIDIAASIAHVLETELPWETDGQSVFGELFPAHNVIEIHNYPKMGDVMRFPASDVTSYPRLAWQVEKFGVRTPLDATVVRGPWPALLGQSLRSLALSMPRPDLFVDSDTENLFADVRLQEGPLPVFLGGRIVSSDHTRRHLSLALAVNGMIVSTTQTFAALDASTSFILTVPVSALKNGWNAVDIFEIEHPDGQPLLRRIMPLRQPEMRIAHNGSDEEVLISPTGNSIPVRPDSVKGRLEAFEVKGEFIILRGRAADLIEEKAASSVLIFADNKLVYSGSPTISNTFQSASRLSSGFYLAIPRSQIQFLPDQLRFFDISNGVAGELGFSR
jgi:Sulfatase